MSALTVLDLFSGIGSFSLGLEKAGMHTVAFVEIDRFCQRVLAKHWPNIPCHADITTREFIENEFAAGSPAKTSRMQATAPELPPPVPGFGGKWFEPFAWFDQNTSSWKTWQRSFLTDWEPFSETWPRMVVFILGCYLLV